jgi:uncharacterized protein involved in exopolysaccharide biosynthesis
MDQMIAEWKQHIREKQDKLRDRPDLAVANLETELQLVDGEVKREQGMLVESEKQISEVMARINQVPGADLKLGALDRDYQTKKTAYDQLLQQAQKIGLGADAVSQQQGEGIDVVDPANLPSRPVAPKRFMLMGMGLAVGLAVGVLLAAMFEVPRLLTIQTSEDAAHYTSLPVLMTLPELLTPQEELSLPRRRKLLLAGAIAVSIVAVPALALILKLTQLFERFAV